MLDDESDYYIRCQQLRHENAALLGDFSRWLKNAGLGAATIRSRCAKLDFYLNHFLLYADTLTAAEGVGYVEVGAFYWTDLTPDIVNSWREEQGSISV